MTQSRARAAISLNSAVSPEGLRLTGGVVMGLRPDHAWMKMSNTNFTVADAYAFTIVNWTNFVGIDLKAYSNLSAYMARVAAARTDFG
jgi:glutathione S-transferase-like protein